MPHLFLLGFMGAGKTTVGQIVAERLGWTFVDTDALVEAEAERTIPEIFELEGEHGFRQRERAALARACEGDRCVVATGGGLVLDPENVSRMRATGTCVVLHAPPEDLWHRVSGSDRPLASDREHFMRRYRDRQSYYESFPLRVSTADSPGHAADRLLAGFLGTEATVTVPLGVRSYPIEIAPNALAELGTYMALSLEPGPCLVVTQPPVMRLWGETARASLERAGWAPSFVTVPDGEAAKTLKEAERLYDAAVEQRLERTHPVVALGGGTVGDLAGFVAATYQRGVPFVQVPTTLLAQVDSSVGGKVAVNHPRGKNLVGAFHQPALVVTDPLTLQTLGDRELRAGLAEVVKLAAVRDAAWFARLEADLPLLLARALGALVPAIERACALKAEIVSTDEREKGLRAILNFGHTVGHAIEAVTHYRTYQHGEAVAAGMVAAGAIAQELGLWSEGEAGRLVAWLTAAALPTKTPGVSRRAIKEAMRHDKKTTGGQPTWVLPAGLGHAELRRDVPDSLVDHALQVIGTAP